jgi:hypothetical protein
VNPPCILVTTGAAVHCWIARSCLDTTGARGSCLLALKTAPTLWAEVLVSPMYALTASSKDVEADRELEAAEDSEL